MDAGLAMVACLITASRFCARVLRAGASVGTGLAAAFFLLRCFNFVARPNNSATAFVATLLSARAWFAAVASTLGAAAACTLGTCCVIAVIDLVCLPLFAVWLLTSVFAA